MRYGSVGSGDDWWTAEGITPRRRRRISGNGRPSPMRRARRRHTFARLGMWKDGIASNEASAAASEMAEKISRGDVARQLHTDGFLLYAYLHGGNDAEARHLLWRRH